MLNIQTPNQLSTLLLMTAVRTKEFTSTFFLLWRGSKGVINFLGFFLSNAEFSPFWALSECIRALIHLACLRSFQWRHGLLFTDCIVWDDKDRVTGLKRSHWIHLGWWSTGSPKLQLFQLSTAFTRHQLSIDIFFSLLSIKYDIKIQNAAIWRFLI